MIESRTAAQPPDRLRFVRTAGQPRLLALLLVVVLIAAACFALGRWQFHRAFERSQLAQHLADTGGDVAGARAIGDTLAPQQKFPGDLVGTTVTATGTFEPRRFYVEGRAVGGKVGYVVMAGLRISDDGVGGASWAGLSGQPVLPVALGWAATLAEATAAQPPTGPVSVVAYLQGGEQAGQAPNADGVIDSISSTLLLGQWGGPIYSAYGVLLDSTPAAAVGLTPLPRPQLDGGEDQANMRNLFYAIEWWVFGGFAVALWIRVVRDESRAGSAAPTLDDVIARGAA
ncbi:SURF1 family protein [Rarobacter incanus]|uniref:SURF1 family protein n=1 Tax=Rarobacter incanus TaxID=153494 RepID=UPI001FE8A8FC|nr:SURF1 family protein [Rarobacter incanus]